MLHSRHCLVNTARFWAWAAVPWLVGCLFTVELGEPAQVPPRLVPNCVTWPVEGPLVLGPTVVGRAVQAVVVVANCFEVDQDVTITLEQTGDAWSLLNAEGQPLPATHPVPAALALAVTVQFLPLQPGETNGLVRIRVGPMEVTALVMGNALEIPEVPPLLDCSQGVPRVISGDLVLGPDTDVLRPQTALALHGIGPAECFEVLGDVLVLGTGLQNLDVLGGLVGVGQDLLLGHGLGGNAQLLGVDGLANLTRVGRHLVVRDNGMLRNVDGLLGLRTVGADVWVENNRSLSDLAGLHQLTRIPGSLEVRNNRRIRSLRGLGHVTQVGGDVRITGNLVLPNVDGLSGLTELPGNLSISFNEALKTLQGLEQLSAVTTYVGIQGNPRLASLEGLRNLRTTRQLVVTQNPALSRLDDLAQLEQVDLLVVSFLDQLRSLSGLANLAAVSRDLIVEGNAVLRDLDLPALTRVGNMLAVRDNPLLPSTAAQDLADRVNPAATDIRNNGAP